MEEKKLDSYPQEGKCPICGSDNVAFSTSKVNEAGLEYECTCHSCGAEFKECYDLVFAGNWNIYDKTGQKYEDLPT